MPRDSLGISFVSQVQCDPIKTSKAINSCKITPTDKKKQSNLLDERGFHFSYICLVHLSPDF